MPYAASTPDSSHRIGFRQNLLRPDNSEREDRVTYVELFFDLIFVFALTQVSSYLYEHQTPTAALEGAVLVLALWWVWVYTTWVTNVLDPARLWVRGAVIVLALVGLVLSTSIFEAYGDRGLVFAVAYVVLQLGRTAFMMAAVARHDTTLWADYRRIMAWLAAASVLWIAGALLPLSWRLPLWVAAIAVEYLSAGVDFAVPGTKRSDVDSWDVSGPHIAERAALFVIIALGESFLVTGFAFVAQEATLPGILGVLVAFCAAVAMWWLYFDREEQVGSKAVGASEKPGRLARAAYTYAHVIIIAGVLLTSVADKEVLAHPLEAMKLSSAVVVVGGPVLYLVGLSVFRRVTTGATDRAYAVALVALLVIGGLSGFLTPLVTSALCTGILLAVAAWGTVARVRRGEEPAEDEG